MKIWTILFILNIISFPLAASIPWAGDYFCLKNLQERVTSDPLVVSEADTLQFFVSVYKPLVTDHEGQGQGIHARFYVDVPGGISFPMEYVRDEENNDVYRFELKPWMLKSGHYRFGFAVSDESILEGSHWSRNNFYWVTKTSYGYTNPSYPNHEWIHSFRTLEVIEDRTLPFLENKK
ncbi:MAG: hypothetical protein HYY62_03030 [Deltaproteobacteria bacterium]|nr:hypothetical protein [Deltaproteobacteria bacterium]